MLSLARLDHSSHDQSESSLSSNSSLDDSLSPSPPLQLQADKKVDQHQANIAQKEDIVPPKRMKKVATLKELQLVLRHVDIAHNKDIEKLLSINEPHVLSYRDKQYLKAKQRGITAQSDDATRLKLLTNVVEFAFMNIEPPNEYTKKTDRKHFKEVRDLTAKFAKVKGVNPSLPLLFAALCHDIERFIPCTKCEYLPESVDKYRKIVIHPITSAKVACVLLKGAPVSKAETDKIYEFIRHHDMPNPREDIVILGRTLVDGISEKWMQELGFLLDADSFAFFESTIGFFIEFKSKKNSPDWIWQRVKVNMMRLSPPLRVKAAQRVNELPLELKKKMAVNDDKVAEAYA